MYHLMQSGTGEVSNMASMTFDHYPRYDELTRIVHDAASTWPHIVSVESIGRSHEGREIWLLTVTDSATGPASEKPAFWVDGSIHAAELAPTVAILHLLHRLVSGHGTDPEVTRCLQTRAFYLVPRTNPDGAELALGDSPRMVRSSTRVYPPDQATADGLIPGDVDGDGHLRQMRIPDLNGPWKVSDVEPRLLVRRDPTEVGGKYYRVLPEGRVRNYDGATIDIPAVPEGLDLNRNFPAQWRREHEQKGAGPYPGSEPEVANLLRFLSTHPNIVAAVAFHTQSGVILRPFSHQSDEAFPAEDLWTYKKLGDRGTELTGYPSISVFHDFRYHPKEVITGAFDDWAYNHLGIFGWTVEIWNPQRHAGIPEMKYIEWYREHPFEDDVKMLAWSDGALKGEGFRDWAPFDHPDLGPIEIGGWDSLYAFGNPPPHLLEAEVARFAPWLIWHALCSPLLEYHSLTAVAEGDGTWRLRVVVQNTGWLPTYVTKHALMTKSVRGVRVEVSLPEGARLLSGKTTHDAGQLEGRAYKPSAPTRRPSDQTDDRAKVEWIVAAPAGAEVAVVASHPRAGTIRRRIRLG